MALANQRVKRAGAIVPKEGVHLRAWRGSRNVEVQFCGGNRTPGIALGDVNGDGRLDLVFGNGRHLPQPNLLYVNGSPVHLFFPPRPLGNSATYAVVLADLDRDGHLDLVEGNDFGFSNGVWINDGRGNFASAFAFGADDRTRDVAVGDVTGDGFPDIVTANFVVVAGDASKVYVNDGRTRFTDARPLAVGEADAAAVALWRAFRNRREVGRLAGLTPTPDQSGERSREQGIAKAGNRYIRPMAIEIAWGWLRFQPESALSQWYQGRFGQGSSRIRRIGIVALARRLLVALWRYLETGGGPRGRSAHGVGGGRGHPARKAGIERPVAVAGFAERTDR